MGPGQPVTAMLMLLAAAPTGLVPLVGDAVARRLACGGAAQRHWRIRLQEIACSNRNKIAK